MCLTSFINLTAALILCLLFVHYMLIAEVYLAILRKVVTVDSLQLQQFLYLMFDFFMHVGHRDFCTLFVVEIRILTLKSLNSEVL